MDRFLGLRCVDGAVTAFAASGYGRMGAAAPTRVGPLRIAWLCSAFVLPIERSWWVRRYAATFNDLGAGALLTASVHVGA